MNAERHNEPSDAASRDTAWQAMSPEAFAQWGMTDIAYIKPVNAAGRRIYVIHAADGETMAQTSDRETAAALILQHDMRPFSTH